MPPSIQLPAHYIGNNSSIQRSLIKLMYPQYNKTVKSFVQLLVRMWNLMTRNITEGMRGKDWFHWNSVVMVWDELIWF